MNNRQRNNRGLKNEQGEKVVLYAVGGFAIFIILAYLAGFVGILILIWWAVVHVL